MGTCFALSHESTNIWEVWEPTKNIPENQRETQLDITLSLDIINAKVHGIII